MQLNEKVSRLASGLGGGRAFLIGMDTGRDGHRFTVHASRASMSRHEARRWAASLGEEMDGAPCRVKRHGSRSLERARSLEAFLTPFRHAEIAYDPTGVFRRATGLVDFARNMRRSFGAQVRKILWQGSKGTLFVVLDRNALPGGTVEPQHLASAEAAMGLMLKDACGDDGIGVIRALKVGFSDPAVAATPVDRLSHVPQGGFLGGVKHGGRISAMAAMLGFGSFAATQAEDGGTGRAVSGLNGEIGLIGGARNGEAALLLEGALAAPLGESFGARIDGVLGTIGGDSLGGGALHLFWRDPQIGLFGFAAGYVQARAPAGGTDGVGVVAGEGEYYLGDATLSALAGYQFSEAPGRSGALARLDVEWYRTEDLMLSAGIETNPEHSWLGRAGLEYRPGSEALPGLSLFAEAAYGANNYHRAYAGFRVYFGGSETLKSRHRRDTFRSHLLPTRLVDSAGLRYGN